MFSIVPFLYLEIPFGFSCLFQYEYTLFWQIKLAVFLHREFPIKFDPYDLYIPLQFPLYMRHWHIMPSYIHENMVLF